MSTPVSQAGISPVTIHHTKQLLSWDCGLACVEALAKTRLWPVREPSELPTAEVLAAKFPDGRVWTIDVVLLLVQYAFIPLTSIRFSTKCPGVNPLHKGKPFYEGLELDSPRVVSQFARALEMGVAIAVESLELDYFRRKLFTGAAVFLCLLDLRWLNCIDCGTPSRALQFTFAGHFVILYGYDFDGGYIFYMDPAADCGEQLFYYAVAIFMLPPHQVFYMPEVSL